MTVKRSQAINTTSYCHRYSHNSTLHGLHDLSFPMDFNQVIRLQAARQHGGNGLVVTLSVHDAALHDDYFHDGEDDDEEDNDGNETWDLVEMVT